ncbi:MAG TPA: histidine kinase [Chitinophagaceae bacterium]|jgi:sensor histidine kinase YesM
MEYDNDRLIKPISKTEIFFWVLLFMFYPLINFLTFFSGSIIFLPILLGISILVFPFYLLYAKVVIPSFLYTKRYVWFCILSVVFYAAVHLLLMFFYSFCHFDQSEMTSLHPYQPYFNYSTVTFIREGLWCILNMLLAAGISFFRKRLDDDLLLATLEKDNTSFKLKYLRSQLNPHFLFNTLNSIYSLCLQKSDQAPEVVIKLADLMRYMIYDCVADRVPLNKEIEFIRNYIEIEKIRHQADVRFVVDGETDNVMIEPLLFVPFIENGFKHAFENSFTNAFIYITLKKETDRISLSIINNTTIDIESQAKRIQGGSITNSKNVLDALYPKSYALDIIQTDKEEDRKSDLRFKHARERLENLYPDSHALDVILSNNAFTVSLIIKPQKA